MKLVAVAVLAGLLAACSGPPAAGPRPDGDANRCSEVTTTAVPTGPAGRLFAPAGPIDSLVGDRLGLERAAVGFPADRVDSEFSHDTSAEQVRCLRGRLLELPAWAENRVHAIAAGWGEGGERPGGWLSALFGELVRLHGVGRPVGATAPELAEPGRHQPLLKAFESVFAVDTPWPTRLDHEPLADHRSAILELAARLGPDTERDLARVVSAMAFAERARLTAVRPWYPDGVDHAELARIVGERAVTPAQVLRFDHASMASAGRIVAGAVEVLAARLAARPLPEVALRLATPLGEVVVSGTRTDDDYVSHPTPALIVDQGGNDTYHGVVAAPANEAVPLSALVDVAGNDRYLGADAPTTQGAGAFSFGVLIDQAGDDTYEAGDHAQGAGFLGVGVLVDHGGRDSYRARYHAQGAGEYGTGVAIDGGGDDQWSLTTFGQGYGSSQSAGLLLDLGGNDAYVADDTALVNPAVSQTKDHNLSMAQGAASGVRGSDESSSIGGGTGVLADMEGDDRYSCAVFCQGSGYWFAHGLLYDGAGNDAYDGVYYTQGAAAHFAFGTLLDVGGDDRYDAEMNVSQGAGHDASAGVLVDVAGNDASGATHLSHGAANDVGVGLFVDGGGDDAYGTSVPTEGTWFGQTASEDFSGRRKGHLSLGLFADLDGSDDYRVKVAGIGNNTEWRLPGEGWAPATHRGLGADGSRPPAGG